MRKSQKLLSLCLGLVLSLGVSGCDDLPSSLDDVGGDEDITSEDLDEESEEPSEPVVSYQVEITNEGPISLEVGQSVTIDLAFCIVTDDVKSSEEGRATLYSSEEGIVSIDGYTVTALKEGETIISANWTEHDVTSNGLTVTVAEPIVTPTTEYSIAITSPASGTSILTNTATSIGVSLTTTVDGTPIVEDGNAETVKLNVSPDTSSVKVEGLTITGTASETVTITATWIEQDITSESISITFVEPSVDPEITYGVTITSPTTETVLYVGSSLTVAATLYTYSDEAVSGSDYATADNVTLTLDENSTGSVTISGLTITGVSAGTVTLTATWGEYASASVTFTVESVYTYAIEISNPTAETTLDVGQTLEVSATLLSYTDGTLTGSETATGSNVTVTQTSGEGSITTSGLTVTGVSAGTVTLTVTWGEYASADVTFEVKSVITYGVAITSPSNGSEVEVGSALTFTIDLITYTDNVETSRDTTTTTGVELTQSSSDGGEVEINGLTITGKTAGSVTITATWTEHSVSDSITITIVDAEPIFETYTYVITFYNSSNESLGALPEGMELYAAGSFNGSGELQSDGDGNEWYEWGEEIVKLTDNSDGTFNLTLNILPRVGLDINIYAHDTSVDDPDTDMWEHYIAYHLITEDDLTNATGTSNLTYNLSLWSETYSSWDEVFYVEESGVTSCTVTLKIQTTGGQNFETAYGDYNVHCQSDYDNWGGDNGVHGAGSDGHKMTNNGDGTYTYKFECAPYNGVDSYTLNVYPGNANGIDWDDSVFSNLTITIASDDSGDITIGADTLISTTSKTSWTDIFPVVENDPTTVDIHIGVKNTNSSQDGSSNNYYVVAGGKDTYYSDSSHLLSADSALSAVVSADMWYTVSAWDKTTDFYFTLHTSSGNYWNTAVLPNPDVTTNNPSLFDFWCYYGVSNGDRCYGLSLSYCSTTLVGVSDIYVVLSFDFSLTNTSSGGHLSDLTYSVTAGYVS